MSGSLPQGRRLIVFEGVDGVGKTSLALLLRGHLRRCGVPCELASFPGQQPGSLSAHIYRLYHAPRKYGVRTLSETAMQVLVTAAHIDVIQSEIVPAIAAGRIVILDRYWWSTWVYGRSAGVPTPFVSGLIELEQLVWKRITPAILFLVDRSKGLPGTEHGTAQRHRLVMSYRRLAKAHAAHQPVRHIRNDGTLEEAFGLVIRSLTPLLPQVAR